MLLNHWITEDWRNHFVLSAELAAAGERTALYRDAERGRFVRVARGAFLRAADWNGLDPDRRHLMRMRAIALTHPGAVFSHFSAAIAWELPIVGRHPDLPHLVADAASGGRSKTGFIRHCVGIPDDLHTIDGLLVTSLARTVIDVAAVGEMTSGVAVADHVLRAPDPTQSGFRAARASRDELDQQLASLPLSSGSARCRRSIAFADGRSGSPGESVSRVAIHRLGFPAPELQARFADGRGLVGIVDFWWPEFGLIGEFDGAGKYLREELTSGRSPGEVVTAEKLREDRLRSLGHRVTRWGWDTARSAQDLRAHLLRAGLRPDKSQPRSGIAARVRLSGA